MLTHIEMEETRRRTTTVRQLELLVEFMEKNRELALGRVRSKEARALSTRLWSKISLILNAEGASRTAKEWTRFWNDYKCRIRSKLLDIKRRNQSSDGGSNAMITFSPLEDRVANIISKYAGSLTGARADPVFDLDVDNIAQEEKNSEESCIKINRESIKEKNVRQLSPNNIYERPMVIQVKTEPVDQPISENDTLPESVFIPKNIPRNVDRPRTRVRRLTRPAQQAINTELSETRAFLTRIEEMRARTEEMIASATLKQAEASLKMADAMLSIANSFKIIADKI